MIIDVYFDEFISSKSLRYDTDLRKTAKTLLKGNKPYSLTQMPGFEESEYLAENIKTSVKAAPRGKDSAIRAYKAFLSCVKRMLKSMLLSLPSQLKTALSDRCLSQNIFRMRMLKSVI